MVKKGKVRITISIHKETLSLINELLPLHNERTTKSDIVEVALLHYGERAIAGIDKKLEELGGKEENVTKS